MNTVLSAVVAQSDDSASPLIAGIIIAMGIVALPIALLLWRKSPSIMSGPLTRRQAVAGAFGGTLLLIVGALFIFGRAPVPVVVGICLAASALICFNVWRAFGSR